MKHIQVAFQEKLRELKKREYAVAEQLAGHRDPAA